jgi:hypothetical protein
MINDLFCDISDKLISTGYFDTVYEYCEIIKRTDGTLRPMYYKGQKAGYVDVQNFDVNGTAYIRKRGNVSVQVDRNATRLSSCVDSSRMVLATFPLRLVVAVPKSQLEDSPLVDDILAADLIGVLQSDMQSTAVAMDAKEINCLVTGYDTDAVTIWAAENKGILFDETKIYRFSYLAIDFICEIRGQVECLQNCLKNEY